MISALLDNQQVLARDAGKGTKGYTCPMCHDTVILRKGLIREHHYAHDKYSDCEYGIGETEQHIRLKLNIFDALREVSQQYALSNVNIETPLKGAIPDVYFTNRDGETVAIEVQRSILTQEDIVRRTTTYHRLGVYVLWIPLLDRSKCYHEEHGGIRYSPSQQEKFIHALYMGQVLYPSEKGPLYVQPAKFGEYLVGDYYDGPTQYGNDISTMPYPSKRYRQLYRSQKHIAIPELRTVVRQSWQSKYWTVPASHIVLPQR